MGQSYFTKEVLEEAEAIAFQPQVWERSQVPGITIDGVESKDLDDAIWIQDKGEYTLLSIHITDVSEYVKLNSYLDQEAMARTQTRYLKYGNDPMLPKVLSENRLSLLEGQARPTLTVNITLDSQAKIQSTDIFESWLRSLKRFSYPEVDQSLKDENSPFHHFLNQCLQWADRLYQQRTDPELRSNPDKPEGAWLDENGNWITGEGSRYHAYLIIQEFMIVANTAIAQWLAERNLSALYRNHIPNLPETDPKALFEILIEAGWEGDLHRQLQCGLNRAEYAKEPIGHFALKLSAYCHFTSPIRRLADLVNHRIIKHYLNGQTHPYQDEQLDTIANHIETVVKAQEADTKEFFKALHQEKYDALLQKPEDLYRLENDEFSLLLKYAATSEKIEILEEQIRDRCSRQQLTVEDWFMILFVGSNRSLHLLILEELQANPHNAPSIIAIAQNQLEEWGDINYYLLGHHSPFQAWLEVEMMSQTWTIEQGMSHSRKQGAKHKACLAWIESYCNHALLTVEEVKRPNQINIPKQEPQPKKNSQGNAVSQLNECCQKYQWSRPRYYFQDAEEFVCECTLTTSQETFTGIGKGTRKAIAKRISAQNILEQLMSLELIDIL